MKKVLIASGVAVLAFAMMASAQGYTFSTNLTVGSTGADVVALQTWLIANGYSIPAVASGAAAKGYFGSQTKAAVVAYQAAKGIPNTGFVGPMTRGALNAGGAVAVTTPVSAGCPVGYTCTANVGTTPVVVTTPGAITTVGIPGTLVYALQTTFNNSTLDKGKSADVARYKLQASASDMQVTSVSFDVNKRLWLYVSSVTIKDDAGTIVASKSGLTASDFSELTVGDSYRLTVPVSYVVPRATSKYFTVTLTALASTDRTSGETIIITSSQARAVDGTGVTDTQSDSTDRNISWTGSSNAAIVTTIDGSSPATKLVQISTSVETDNVPMGIFDIKSQNTDTTLRTLKVFVNSNTGPSGVSSLFNDIKVKIAGNTYSADSIVAGTSSSTVTFTNLNVTLPKDVYVPVTILGKVAKNVSGSATTTLVANTTNVVVEDASYASVTVNSATIAANAQTFTASGVAASGLTVTKEAAIAPQAGGISRIITLAYTLTAGDNAVYVSKTQATAISSTTSLGTAGTATTTPYEFKVNDTSGDGTTYFYIAPGQSKTFTAGYKATGSSPTTSTASLTVTSLNYSTADTTGVGGTLNSSDIQSAFSVSFF